MKRTNRLVTIFGGLAVLGGIPEGVTRAGFKMPLVWNSITPWLSLCGVVFTALAFWAAKGADTHSNQAQITAASAAAEAEIQVKTADAAVPIEKVEVVKPPAVKGIVIPSKPPAKPKV